LGIGGWGVGGGGWGGGARGPKPPQPAANPQIKKKNKK